MIEFQIWYRLSSLYCPQESDSITVQLWEQQECFDMYIILLWSDCLGKNINLRTWNSIEISSVRHVPDGSQVKTTVKRAWHTERVLPTINKVTSGKLILVSNCAWQAVLFSLVSSSVCYYAMIMATHIGVLFFVALLVATTGKPSPVRCHLQIVRKI